MQTTYSKREEQLAQLAREAGTLRARELKQHGIARSYLRQLVERGFLEKKCLRERRATREELYHFARIGRVERIMRPYMEAFAVSL